MNTLQGLVMLLATLSVAVERAVEILKSMLGPLLPPGKNDNVRAALIHISSAALGGIASMGIQSQLDSLAPWLAAKNIGPWSYVLLGLLTSGGSAFWNHILDIIMALKVQKEQLAGISAPAKLQPPQPQMQAAAAGK